MRPRSRLEAHAYDLRSYRFPCAEGQSAGYPVEMEPKGKDMVGTSLAVLSCVLTMAVLLCLLNLCGI